MAQRSGDAAGGWDTAPCALVFADSGDGRALAVDHVLRAGGRVAAALPIEQALERLGRQIALDLVVLDVSYDHGPM
ncbi:MAG: hypothetical protein EOP61_39040, partial [Sphingomonadales bacterium]